MARLNRLSFQLFPSVVNGARPRKLSLKRMPFCCPTQIGNSHQTPNSHSQHLTQPALLFIALSGLLLILASLCFSLFTQDLNDQHFQRFAYAFYHSMN